MDTYRIVSRLSVRHPYFEAGWPAGLQLRPESDSAALMTRFGLLLRGDAQRYVVLASDARREALWRERASWPDGGLVFTLASADPLWAYYTDVRALGTPVRVVMPLAVPDCANQDAWLQAAPVEQTLALPVRQTIWKYLLLGAWGDELAVVDAADGVSFTGPEKETLPNGDTAVVFRACAPLALAERPGHRFQLRRGTGPAGRLLVPRLPLAAPAGLRREVVDGVLRDVSEIFVNR